MSTVEFPGLGLVLHINRVALQIGSFSIYWYGIIIALGFVFATLFGLHYAERFGMKKDDYLDFMLFLIPSCIVGARLYYIIFYPDLYRDAQGHFQLSKCLDVHSGGLAIYGGILAGLLVMYLVARHKKIPFLSYADLTSFGILIGQIMGRWGNFLNVEAYGRETNLPWRMGIDAAVNGSIQHMEVHPTFLYESLWNLIGLCILLVLLKKGYKKFDGMYFCMYIMWYGLGRAYIEGLRTDSLYFFSTGLRVSQVLGLVSGLIAAVILIVGLCRSKGRDSGKKA